MAQNQVLARLYVIQARETPRAVIFRRGPTDWYRLSLWHTDVDRFEHGHWLKGRLYPKRSDLTPDGRYLIYFADKQTGYHISPETSYSTSWIAISKPPYLTALALWNVGSTYCPGGLFRDQRTVWLPFKAGDDATHPDHPVRGFAVETGTQLPAPPFFGLMEHRGWTLHNRDEIALKWPILWQPHQPLEWHKAQPGGPFRLVLEKTMTGYETSSQYFVANENRQLLIALDHFTWADWDHSGRLVGTRNGQVLAMNPEVPNEDVVVLEDVNDQRPDPQPAPDWAQKW